MPESVSDLIGRILQPPPRAVPPAPPVLAAIGAEPLQALIGRVISAPGTPPAGASTTATAPRLERSSIAAD